MSNAAARPRRSTPPVERLCTTCLECWPLSHFLRGRRYTHECERCRLRRQVAERVDRIERIERMQAARQAARRDRRNRPDHAARAAGEREETA